MTTRSVVTFGLLGILVLGSPSGRLEASDLATGIRQVKDGDFETAILTLDAAIRGLTATQERSGDLAKAYLYLGVAYVGLGQEALAKSKFRLALGQQRDLRLADDEFPAKVVRIFEAAREAQEAVAASERDAKRSRGKGGLILLGLGGVTAAGIAVAVTGERSNAPPTATFSAAPEGQPLVHVTAVEFSASASDTDGDVLSYSWSFGDGTSATGARVTKVFSRTGAMEVRLTVGDGLASVTVSSSIAVGDFAGSWRVAGQAFLGVSEFRFSSITPAGFVDFSVFLSGGAPASALGGALVTHPRKVAILYETVDRACRFSLDGEADGALRILTGTLTAVVSQRDACPELGSQQTITLTRE